MRSGSGRAVVGRKLDGVRAEVGGRPAVPDGFVIGALGDGNARADHGLEWVPTEEYAHSAVADV